MINLKSNRRTCDILNSSVVTMKAFIACWFSLFPVKTRSVTVQKTYSRYIQIVLYKLVGSRYRKKTQSMRPPKKFIYIDNFGKGMTEGLTVADFYSLK